MEIMREKNLELNNQFLRQVFPGVIPGLLALTVSLSACGSKFSDLYDKKKEKGSEQSSGQLASISVTDTSGKEVNVGGSSEGAKASSAKAQVIMFAGIGCGGCVREAKNFAAAYNDEKSPHYKALHAAELYTLVVGATKEEAQKFASDYGIKWTIAPAERKHIEDACGEGALPPCTVVYHSGKVLLNINDEVEVSRVASLIDGAGKAAPIVNEGAPSHIASPTAPIRTNPEPEPIPEAEDETEIRNAPPQSDHSTLVECPCVKGVCPCAAGLDAKIDARIDAKLRQQEPQPIRPAPASSHAPGYAPAPAVSQPPCPAPTVSAPRPSACAPAPTQAAVPAPRPLANPVISQPEQSPLPVAQPASPSRADTSHLIRGKFYNVDSGQTDYMSNYWSGPLVVTFSRLSCGTCKTELSKFREARDNPRSRLREVQIVSIFLNPPGMDDNGDRREDTPEDIRKAVRRKPWKVNWTVGVNSSHSFFNSYCSPTAGLPCTIVHDPVRGVVSIHQAEVTSAQTILQELGLY